MVLFIAASMGFAAALASVVLFDATGGEMMIVTLLVMWRFYDAAKSEAGEDR